MTVQFITTIVGTVGFSLVFRLLPKHLSFVALGGLISFGIFTIAEFLGMGLYFANFLAAAATAFYAELCARVLRACPARSGCGFSRALHNPARTGKHALCSDE